MTEHKSFLFFINPVSGSAKKDWISIFEKYRKPEKQFEYLIWESADDKDILAEKLKKTTAECLVAVGGDGTINFVSGIALETGKSLGIIPSGSGNGLARHLNIPLKADKALDFLQSKGTNAIDVGSVNGNHFLCTAGIGFDALIGQEFAKRDKMGLSGYAGKVLKHVFTYKAQNYALITKERKIEHQALLITFANASQYGNNAYIAPEAKIQDGNLNICVLKPFPLILVPIIAFRLFNKSIHKSSYLHTFLANEIEIRRESGPIHLDGEAHSMNGKLKFEILPKKLSVIC